LNKTVRAKAWIDIKVGIYGFYGEDKQKATHLKTKSLPNNRFYNKHLRLKIESLTILHS